MPGLHKQVFGFHPPAIRRAEHNPAAVKPRAYMKRPDHNPLRAAGRDTPDIPARRKHHLPNFPENYEQAGYHKRIGNTDGP